MTGLKTAHCSAKFLEWEKGLRAKYRDTFRSGDEHDDLHITRVSQAYADDREPSANLTSDVRDSG